MESEALLRGFLFCCGEKKFLHSSALSIDSGNLPCQVVAGLNDGYGVDQNFSSGRALPLRTRPDALREVGKLCAGVFLMPGQGATLTARF